MINCCKRPIDDKCSDFARVAVDVPQRSILGPVILDLYVADLQDGVKCKSFQYEDNIIFFGHVKVADLSGAIDDMNRRLDCLGAYSSESHLAVNWL